MTNLILIWLIGYCFAATFFIRVTDKSVLTWQWKVFSLMVMFCAWPYMLGSFAANYVKGKV